MSFIKAKRLFSLLALFSIAFNNLSTPLYVYAQEAGEPTPDQTQQIVEPVTTDTTVITDTTPTPNPDVPNTDIAPVDPVVVDPTPATDAAQPTQDATQPVDPQTNEGALPDAPPTDTPTPTVDVVTPEGDEKLQVNIIEDVQAVSIDFMDIQYNPDGTASIKTDKLDYAPTDVVVVTGTGFDVNKEYDLLITGTDNFSYSDKVTTNDKGEILYSYQLDGTYRPDYKVEVKSGDVIIATVTFTDADTLALVPNGNGTYTTWDGDYTGVNETSNFSCSNGDYVKSTGVDTRESFTLNLSTIANNKIITSVAITVRDRGDDHSGGTYKTFTRLNGTNLDASSTLNASGGSQDPCSSTKTQTIDVPDTVKNGSTTLEIGVVKVAGDSDTVRIGTITAVVTYVDQTAASISINTINGIQPPFSFSCPTNPTQNPVTVTGNGAGSAPPGLIEQYHVQIDWGDGTFTNGLGTFVPVSGQGNFTYTFNSGAHTYLTSGPFTIKARLYHSQPPGNDNQADVVASASVCISAPSGTIKVIKDVVPNDSTKWDFAIAGPTNNNVSQLGDGGQSSVFTSNTGAYTITETAHDPANTNLYTTTYNCTGAAAPITGSGKVASFTLVAGQSMVCTFTNTIKPVTFTVNKYIDADGSLATSNDRTPANGWSFQIFQETPNLLVSSGTISSGGTIDMPTFDPVSGKTYKVVEQSMTGFSPLDSKCKVAAANVGQGGSNGQVTGISVTPGATIICDFINRANKGSLKIIKDTIPNDTENFKFVVSTPNGNVDSVVLDDDGETFFRSNTKTFTLNAGSYTVTETEDDGGNDWMMSNVSCTGPGQWSKTGQSSIYVDVVSGSEMVCTFTNIKLGEIYGHKYNDKNGDNTDDSGDTDLQGWKIFIDEDGDGVWDTGEDYDITNSGGDYSFNHLIPGDYKVCEVPQAGWVSSLPQESNCQTTTLTSGDTDELNFGNHGKVTIKAYKIVCPMESSLPNWGDGVWWSIGNGTADWFLSNSFGCYYEDNWEFQWGYGGAGGVQPVDGDAIGIAPNTGGAYNQWKTFNTPTDNNLGGQTPAQAEIWNLMGASSLWVREILPSSDWLPFSDDVTFPRNNVSAEIYCSGDILNYDNYDRIDDPLFGETYYCVAFNTLNKGNITGTKWEDVDGDGKWDDGENPIAGWTITLEDSNGYITSTQTNASGDYQFSDLKIGDYTVCEENQFGYVQTYPGGSCHDVTVVGGQTQGDKDFGNQPVRLGITIDKSNVLNTSNGTVDYTINVKNSGSHDLNSFEVHDALPGGFSYISGSSELDGVAVPDPTLNSGELLWSFSETLAKDETKTLTYRVSVSSDLPAGEYTNFAYASGIFFYPWCNIPEVDEFALRTEQSCEEETESTVSEIDDSVVALSTSVSYGGKLVGQVLGASTEVLPATGSETWVIMLATALVIVGFATKGAALIIEERKRRHA